MSTRDSEEQAPADGERQGFARKVGLYWATAGACAIIVAAVTVVIAQMVGGSSDGTQGVPSDQPTTGSPPAASPPTSPTSPTSPSDPSTPPSPAETTAEPPASFELVYERKELEIPDRQCPKLLFVDFDGPQVSREDLDGADGQVCSSAANLFDAYEPRGVQLADVEKGVTAEECWQAVDDDPYASTVFSLRPFCLRTGEGTIVYVEANYDGSVLLLTAWRPATEPTEPA